jgi:hypothetical protein
VKAAPAIALAALVVAACSGSSPGGGATTSPGRTTAPTAATPTTAPATAGSQASTTTTTGASGPTGTALPTTSAPAATIDVAAGLANLGLVRTWYHHGFDLTIRADGSGTANWRVYRTCPDGPPPCDRFVGNQILDGGHATFSVRPVPQSSVAVAVMASSTDPTMLGARGTVQVTPVLGRQGPGREIRFPTLRDPTFVLCDDAALLTGDCGA